MKWCMATISQSNQKIYFQQRFLQIGLSNNFAKFKFCIQSCLHCSHVSFGLHVYTLLKPFLVLYCLFSLLSVSKMDYYKTFLVYFSLTAFILLKFGWVISGVYLLSLLWVGYLGKKAQRRAATAGGEVLRVYLPPPRNSSPIAMCVARCEPYVTVGWPTRECRKRHNRITSRSPDPAITLMKGNQHIILVDKT